jgi:rhomboid family GlyGly-CTERM serine protease
VAHAVLTTQSAQRTRGARLWITVAALLAVPALYAALAGVGMAPVLDWQPGLASREPWRLWSAAWVHLNNLHLAANIAGTLLVGALGVAAGVTSRAAMAWALAWPLTHAALWLRPDVAHYAGLSGVLHAGVMVVAVRLMRDHAGRARAIGFALAAGVLVKVVAEAPWADVLPWSSALGIATVPFAHAAGAFAGAACSWALGVAAPLRSDAGAP